MQVRPATEADLPAIHALYNALIATTTVTWRDDPASLAEMQGWFAGMVQDERPVLVATLGGTVAGYTCWSSFRGGDRTPGYRHTVELTIHVDGAHHGHGVGRALLSALMDEARRRGMHVMVAGVDGENVQSLAFHEAMGFTEVARMPEVGRKFDRWLDLVLLQRILG